MASSWEPKTARIAPDRHSKKQNACPGPLGVLLRGLLAPKWSPKAAQGSQNGPPGRPRHASGRSRHAQKRSMRAPLQTCPGRPSHVPRRPQTRLKTAIRCQNLCKIDNPQELYGILQNSRESYGILGNPSVSAGTLWKPEGILGNSRGILANPREPSGSQRIPGNPSES